MGEKTRFPPCWLKEYSVKRENPTAEGRTRERSSSLSRVEDEISSFTTKEEEEEKEEYVFEEDISIHSPRESLISQDHSTKNFQGFVHLAFILLVIGGLRLCLENMNKYGLICDPLNVELTYVRSIFNPKSNYISVYLYLYSNVPVLLTLFLEKSIAKEFLCWRLGCFMHMVNLFFMLLIPMVVINVRDEHISMVSASGITILYATLFLKLWSYIMVNHWCRCNMLFMGNQTISRHTSIYRPESIYWGKLFNPPSPTSLEHYGEKDKKTDRQTPPLVMWPDNLTMRDIYYFWLSPTLCYELNFPRSYRVRTIFLIRRCLEIIVGVNISVAVVQQYMVPSVVNSLLSFASMDVAHASERLLKLAVPNHLLWLIWFYLVFHSTLNTLGELLRFGDRNFYSDWWNAKSIDKFWRKWNIPVHRWCVRHLYIPLLACGFSKGVARHLVFFASAFFHEYLISVPLRVLKMWSFIAMIIQPMLFPISRFFHERFGPRFGNLTVWISLIIGQPLAVMMYYHDYIVEHHGRDLLTAYGQATIFLPAVNSNTSSYNITNYVR